MVSNEAVRREWKNEAVRRNELAESHFIEGKYLAGLITFTDALNYAISSEDNKLSQNIEENYRYHIFRLYDIELKKVNKRGYTLTDENRLVLLSEYTSWFADFGIFLEDIISQRKS